MPFSCVFCGEHTNKQYWLTGKLTPICDRCYQHNPDAKPDAVKETKLAVHMMVVRRWVEQFSKQSLDVEAYCLRARNFLKNFGGYSLEEANEIALAIARRIGMKLRIRKMKER